MKPLAGKRIVVTRPAGQSAPFIGKIEKAGGTAYAVPLIAFKEAFDQQDEKMLSRLHTYDWIIFTSKNGVDFFMRKAGSRLQELDVKWAAIGTKTAKAMNAYGLTVSYMPLSFSADDVADEIQSGRFSPRNALIPKGNLARSLVGQAIRQNGGQADDWIVYETYFPEEAKRSMLELIRSKGADMYTFTSPSAVRHFAAILTSAGEPLPAADYAVIGPVTEKEAKAFGIPVSISPEEYTVDALMKEITTYYKE